jgi:N-acylneuraminate cytidylyltransferase
MQILCIIPARSGSKRVPRKNLLPVGGWPLVAHSIRHALAARRVTETVVSTDSAEIAALAAALGAQALNRPADISGDTASSESALLHVLDTRQAAGLPDPGLIVFLQCTSPVRRADDIDKAIERLLDSGADSLFSACDNKRLIWKRGGDRTLTSLTHDFAARRREQEMNKQYYENGSIYVFPPSLLRSTQNRLSGRIEVYEMDFWTSFQLDGDDDVALIDWILRRPEFSAPAAWPERIELVVFDFDGVMTDNTVSVAQDGTESVICNRSDGLGIDGLRDAGIPALILSTERNSVVKARADKLQLPCLHGIADKAAALAEWIAARGISAENVVYLGNDRIDLGCFQLVGMPVAVADAHPSASSAAKLILSRAGGQGAVRELCDLVLARMTEANPHDA